MTLEIHEEIATVILCHKCREPVETVGSEELPLPCQYCGRVGAGFVNSEAKAISIDISLP